MLTSFKKQSDHEHRAAKVSKCHVHEIVVLACNSSIFIEVRKSGIRRESESRAS